MNAEEKLECPNCGLLNTGSMTFYMNDGSIICDVCGCIWTPGEITDQIATLKKSWNRFSILPSIEGNEYQPWHGYDYLPDEWKEKIEAELAYNFWELTDGFVHPEHVIFENEINKELKFSEAALELAKHDGG